ncbi:RNA polymerase sigma factor [Novosphingobium guangzhouense]|uniref:RNA polymerase subunit sigma-24 n=1 Tax=Novosphingobium guangzhouense TaxID=1850347 RepID=A0A2K2FWU1_9SPHN|nr:sigma-70 family RNA polymerase sigma factor [Novosphingobium guangzhouense]PNU03259.1 RNA polymerase subunit sigma-24 [Novosphingobium guangzhouense]
MSFSRERAVWLGRNVFPHEAALRQWLSARAASAGLEVDDVVQETYAILASIERVDHIRNARTYMFEVAKSVVLQSLRRARIVTIDVQANAQVLDIPEDAPTPERVVADRQELSQVSAAIAALPERCREVFTLRKIQGLSQRQVAQSLGIAESTVEKHMVKAMAILTNAIGRGGNVRDASSSPRDQQTDNDTRERSPQRERA